ncbi:MAG: hypothetical protein JXB62_13715 [Pirellulales bacterium]|nr:hypothetical protein [Pirellulales bacterium]
MVYRVWLGLMILGAALLVLPGVAAAGRPVLEGYTDYGAYRLQLESIGAAKYAELESLGSTRGRRDVFLLTIASGKADTKPAILVVGGVDPPHLVGSELAVRLARRLVERAEEDHQIRGLLDRITFYVIPRAAPDACEAFFQQPYRQRAGNERPTDDDSDGELDEDGAEDLNGDGWITMLRVAEPTGTHMPHPDDARLMIEADRKRDEQGRYSLYIEGRDDDEDERFGEDPAGGVAFNRNFTFRYPYLEQGAGPHQVSEVETRAVADFAFDHPNIAAVLTFTPEDNLMRPWKAGTQSDSKKIEAKLLPADAPYFDFVAEQYREIHGGENPPDSTLGHGSFSEWAYFHYGRWSFGCRGWWIPRVEPDDPRGDEEEQHGGEAVETVEDGDEEHQEPSQGPPEKNEPKEERGAAELNALRWFTREGIDGFVEWTKIEHPGFPGKRVEVGGFKPFLRLNPPADRLDALVEKHEQFVLRLAEWLPRVAIEATKVEPLGGGAWRVTAVVVNQGYLPTMSEMGCVGQQPYPLQVELELPEGVSLATGSARGPLPALAGHGGSVERIWLVLAPETGRTTLTLRVWSPSVGSQTETLTLAAPDVATMQATKAQKKAEPQKKTKGEEP